jgi:hypothetical protein
MLYKRMGVWHNPRIKKQKQYIPKYALTHCQSYSLFISCQTYCIDDWFVSKNIYVRVRETLAAANRLQRYNKKLKYTKEFMFFVVFLLSRTQITSFRYVPLCSD